MWLLEGKEFRSSGASNFFWARFYKHLVPLGPETPVAAGAAAIGLHVNKGDWFRKPPW